MKQLITESITINGLSRGRVITLFNITSDEQLNATKYYDLAKLAGKRVQVTYKFSLEDSTHLAVHSQQLEAGLTAEGVRDAIIASIQNKLQA